MSEMRCDSRGCESAKRESGGTCVRTDCVCRCHQQPSDDEAPKCGYRFVEAIGGGVCGLAEDDPMAYHDHDEPEPCCGWHEFEPTVQAKDKCWCAPVGQAINCPMHGKLTEPNDRQE